MAYPVHYLKSLLPAGYHLTTYCKLLYVIVVYLLKEGKHIE